MPVQRVGLWHPSVNPELLIDLKLDRETMAVPAEAAWHVVTSEALPSDTRRGPCEQHTNNQPGTQSLARHRRLVLARFVRSESPLALRFRGLHSLSEALQFRAHTLKTKSIEHCSGRGERPGDNVLDAASEDVTVVRQTRREWRAVVEDELCSGKAWLSTPRLGVRSGCEARLRG